MTDDNLIAICGIGCKLPGGSNSWQDLWKMLEEGRHGYREIPRDRWDPRAHYDPHHTLYDKMYVRKAGIVDIPYQSFDASFFRMSAKEAELVDPQQRLILEATWEALEDAGLPAETLEGTDTGVFVGGFALDRLVQLMSPINSKLSTPQSVTAGMMTMLSARLSHFFGLTGPSVSMDTACSSSLVCCHYACHSLRAGECSIALVGGVNFMLDPRVTIAMSQGNYLSPDGMCKTFDARGNGYGRAEGSAMIVLCPEDKAKEMGLPIYALIKATGVNQDGSEQGGITVPNKKSQVALIKRVMKEAHIGPEDIDYYEAHGTGTPVGDPIELSAIGETRKHMDVQKQAYVSSIKANIGHTEAAAGVAGLIKAALVLKHRRVPPHLHFSRLPDGISLEGSQLTIPVEGIEFTAKGPLHAAINSFGYGGTNGHVILGSPPEDSLLGEAAIFPKSSDYPLPLSANDGDALAERARDMLDWLDRNPKEDLGQLGLNLGIRRSALKLRIVPFGKTKEDLKASLRRVAESHFDKHFGPNRVLAEGADKLLFIYTGMGAQWPQMAADLLESNGIFREVIKKSDHFLSQHAGWSLVEELKRPKDQSKLLTTAIAQPANFAVGAGLTAVWEHLNIMPNAVLGHSIGEVGAAHASGRISLEEGLLISSKRAELQARKAGLGGMLAVGVDEELAHKYMGAHAGEVDIAAVNSFQSVTLSGDIQALQSIAKKVEADGHFQRMLNVEVAYHSHQLEDLKKEFLEAISSVQPKNGKIPMYSTVSGRQLQGLMTADYWWSNVISPVRFADAYKQALSHGLSLSVQVGPHPVLTASIKEVMQDVDVQGASVPSLVRDEKSEDMLMSGLSKLWSYGYGVDWKHILPGVPKRLDLPKYPWQRVRHWAETKESTEERIGTDGHPMYTRQIETPWLSWKVLVNDQYFPYIHDHSFEGVDIFPGASYGEMAISFARKIQQEDGCSLQNIDIKNALTLPPGEEAVLHLKYYEKDRLFSIWSLKGDTWTEHFEAELLDNAVYPEPISLDLEKIQERSLAELEPADFYGRYFDPRSMHYGPTFRLVERVWKGDGEILLQCRASELSKEESALSFHPGVLDTALQAGLVCFPDVALPPGLALPTGIDALHVMRSFSGGVFWAYAKALDWDDKGNLKANFMVLDKKGSSLMMGNGARSKILIPSEKSLEQTIFENVWQAVEEDTFATYKGRWAVFTFPGCDSSCVEDLLLANGPSADLSQCTRILLFAVPSQDTILDPQMEIEWTVHFQSIVKTLSTQHPGKKFQLFVVTNASQCQHAAKLQGASLWGFSRVVRSEYPNLLCTLVDWNPDVSMEILVDTLNSSFENEELAWKEGRLFAQRLVQASERLYGGENEKELCSARDTSFELKVALAGSMDSIEFEEIQKKVVGPKEIEIEVHYTPINFKDLMKVMGVIDPLTTDDTYLGNTLGMEGVGVVRVVGGKVTRFKEGDRVTFVAPAAFASVLVVGQDYAFCLPDNIPDETGSVVVPFATAYQALFQLAKLKAKDRVLIHTATGGVGLAAVQYAKALGSKIFATAGSIEKREYLRSIGIEHVMDSRSLRFADEIMEFTGGEGVDVVLNTLTGPAMVASWQALAPYGRFIEIGKRDIADNTGLPMRPFNDNRIFAGVDLDRICLDRPREIRKIVDQIQKDLAEEKITPLPVKFFPIERTSDAFRFMAQAKHIGRVTLQFKGQSVPVGKKAHSRPLFRSDKSYIISGGLGGFGLQVAKWMTVRGAKHLILLSRSGARLPEAKAFVADMKRQGMNICALRVDVTDFEDLKKAVEGAAGKTAPLGGVIHAAAVLSDGTINELSASQIRRVMGPKVIGAWNLHRLTEGFDLDTFVLFSSFTSLVGSTGQANYVAANAFLDALSHYRKSLELPSTTINWGMLSEAGMLTRESRAIQQMARVGIEGFRNAEAFEVLDRAIMQSVCQVAAIKVDWEKWMALNPVAKSIPVFGALVEMQSSLEGEISPGLKRYLEQGEQDRLPWLTFEVKAKISQVTQIPVERIDDDSIFEELGLDSLMAVELTNIIKAEFPIELSAMEMSPKLSIAQITGIIEKRIQDLLSGQSPESKQEESLSGLDSKQAMSVDEMIMFAKLPSDIQPAKECFSGRPERIFLTGATGYVGAYLLAELLDQSDAEITCLVRASSKDHALERLQKNLSRFQLKGDLSRVKTVLGDLSHAQFGLSDREYQGLCGEIQCIWHGGALVNWVADFETVKTPNVFGTEQVIRLAATKTTKPIHFVSSVGVFTTEENRHRVIEEDIPLAASGPLLVGYSQSKWISEKMVREAEEKGVPAAIYRINTGGDLKTGLSNPRDYLNVLMRGCIELGQAPYAPMFTVQAAPIDYVGKALVHLSLQERSIGKTYHIVNNKGMDWMHVVDLMQDWGYSIEKKSFGDWVEQIYQTAAKRPDLMLDALLPLFPGAFEEGMGLPTFKDTVAEKALEGTCIACPPLTADLLKMWLEKATEA